LGLAQNLNFTASFLSVKNLTFVDSSIGSQTLYSLMRFRELLEQYREDTFAQKDKRGKFDRLMAAYLQTDSKYAYKFKKV